MKFFRLYFYFLIGFATISLVIFARQSAHAQFDPRDTSKKSAKAKAKDAKSNQESEDNDSGDDSTSGLPEAKSNDEAPEQNEVSKESEITKAELEELATAFKKKSEPALIKAAGQILSKNPSHLVALNALAIHYFENKKFGLAKIILKRAIKDHPSEPALMNNLGIIYLSEGETRLAIEEFRKSLSARSDYRFAATNLSTIYLDYRDYSRSIAPLEESYKAAHSDLRRGDMAAIEIANNYGVALMGTGENSKAEEVFSEIVNTNVRNPVPYLNYAILLVEVQKKKNDAIRVLSKLKFMTDDRDILRRVQELERKIE